MGQVKIQESSTILKNGKNGKVAFLIYDGVDDPVGKLDSAVSEYVGNVEHKHFVDINMDNPWIRVVVSGINEMEKYDFNPKEHNLKNLK